MKQNSSIDKNHQIHNLIDIIQQVLGFEFFLKKNNFFGRENLETQFQF